MLNSRLALLVISFICFLTTASAQELLSTQYESAALLLNSAQTGQFDGKYRLTTGYRNQSDKVLRSSAFKGFGLSADTRFKTKKENTIGLGIAGYQNEKGSIGTRQVQLSIAYHKKMSKSENQDHTLSMGMDYGLAHRRYIGVSDLPAGFDGGKFYGDLGLGIQWRSSFVEDQEFYLGVAVRHINEPDLSFEHILVPSELPVSYVFHGGGELSVRNNFSLLPKVYYQCQGEYGVALPSLSLKKYFKSDSAMRSIQFGLMTRHESSRNNAYDLESISAIAQLDFDKYRIGFSYDHNISELQQAHNIYRALEISMGYIIGAE